MDGEAQPQPTSSDFNNAPAADANATDPNNMTGMQETNEFGEPI